MIIDNKETNKILSDFYNTLNLNIKNIILLVLSYLYCTGYLVQAATLRNFGIYRLETLKFHYIEVGFTFSVLIALVTIIPVGCYLAHFRIRRKSNLPHFKIGAITYLINTYNLFLIITFFSIFITMKEWTYVLFQFDSNTLQIRLNHVMLLYLSISLIVLILFPLLERFVRKNLKSYKLIYNYIIEPFRIATVLVAITFDVVLLISFPWIGSLLLKGLTFIATSIMIITVIYVIGFYMNKLGDKRSFHVLACVGSVGVIVLLFICLNAYVYSVVRYIPMNRGGKLPITRSYLITTNKVFDTIPINKTITTENTKIGPVYIIEETQDYLYIAKECENEWFDDWASTFAIKKDVIQYIKNERITMGGPR